MKYRLHKKMARVNQVLTFREALADVNRRCLWDFAMGQSAIVEVDASLEISPLICAKADVVQPPKALELPKPMH